MEIEVNRFLLRNEYTKNISLKATKAAQYLWKILAATILITLFVIIRLCMWCCCSKKKVVDEEQKKSTSHDDVKKKQWYLIFDF